MITTNELTNLINLNTAGESVVFTPDDPPPPCGCYNCSFCDNQDPVCDDPDCKICPSHSHAIRGRGCRCEPPGCNCYRDVHCRDVRLVAATWFTSPGRPAPPRCRLCGDDLLAARSVETGVCRYCRRASRSPGQRRQASRRRDRAAMAPSPVRRAAQ